MIRTCGRETFVRNIAVKIVPLVGQDLGQCRIDDHNALMRPIGLIGGKQVDIRTKLTQIRQAVRCVGHAIDADKGAAAAWANAVISVTGLISPTTLEQCGKQTSRTLSSNSGSSAFGSRWPVAGSICHSTTSIPASANRRQGPEFAS